MSEFGQALLDGISRRFAQNVANDRKIRTIAKRIRDGTSYEDAQQYAERLGELLSDAMKSETGNLSYMSREVAGEVLNPLLSQDHDLICEAIETVQKNMNAEAGVGLNPVLPELDTNRIEGLADKISSYENFEDARWLTDEPLVNFSESVVDRAIRDNAKKSSEAGLTARIIRKAEPAGTKTRKIGKKTYSYRVPCRWCTSLEGSWEYGDEPADVFRRHAFCRCSVTFKNGKMSQDVWSKATWDGDDAEEAQKAIREKQEEKARQNSIKEAERKQRISDIERIQRELGYSARGASIFRNAYKQSIEKYGLDYVIDSARNQNAWAAIKAGR